MEVIVSKEHKNNTGYLYLINTVLLFSTYEVVSKALVGKINPFQVNFIRFLVGGMILFSFLLIKGDVKVNKSDLFKLTGIGFINVVVSLNLLQLSLYVTGASAAVVAVIFSSNPVFVALFSAILDKEKVTITKVLGLVIGMTGIFVVFMDKLGNGSMSFISPLLALASAIFYGLYTVVGRKVSSKTGSLKMNAYSFLLGSLLLLPVLFFIKVQPFIFDYSAIPQIIYLSVFVSGLAYLTYFKGLEQAGASKGSMVFFLKPVIASTIAVIFLGERLHFGLIAGTILVLVGIATVLYGEILATKLKKVF